MQTFVNGLVSIEIGTGLPITGTFSAIDWSGGPYYLKTETDPTGATNYTVVGTNELLSVPYSFLSKISQDVVNNSVTSAKIADGTIAATDLADGSVTSAKIADGTIATSDLSTGSVTSAKILDLAIGTTDLADGSITSAKIADGTIATVDLVDGIINSAKIADESVANADLAANSVAGPKIIDLSIGTADLADGSVTSGKIADGNIATADLANGAVTTAKISSTGALTDYVMQYTGSSVAWDYAPGAEIRYTVLNVTCNTPVPVNTTYAKVADIGSFSKLVADSRLEVTYFGRVQVATFDAASTGAVFELRVDNAATTVGRARATLKDSDAGYKGIQISMSGIFTGLATGTHTVSVWVRTYYGTGTEARVDPGCWQTDHVIVREIK